ncbi:hypothetical protein ACMZ5F_16110 [Streptomyces rhizosphaericola]|uniref:hypothetical protein n=1 Tax=Streptomyces rhizosphaericola TaxID=2564098 RepID=UPI0039EEA3C3
MTETTLPLMDIESGTDLVVRQAGVLLDLTLTREAVPPAVVCQLTEAVAVLSAVISFLPGASPHLRAVTDAMTAVRAQAIAELDRARN